MPELSVKIGSDIKDLNNGLKQAEKNVGKFDDTIKKSNTKIAVSNKVAARSMGTLKKGTANAVPALNEFSRVIQDAPFGIQGDCQQYHTTND